MKAEACNLTYQALLAGRRSTSRPRHHRLSKGKASIRPKNASASATRTFWIIVCRSSFLPTSQTHPFRDSDRCGESHATEPFFGANLYVVSHLLPLCQTLVKLLLVSRTGEDLTAAWKKISAQSRTYPCSFGGECFDYRLTDAPGASRDQTGLPSPVRRHFERSGFGSR